MLIHQRIVARSQNRHETSVPRRAHPWKTHLSVLAMICLVVAGLGFATAGEAKAGSAATINTDVLSLRAEPTTDGALLVTMMEGDRVDVLYGPTDGGWYEVRFEGIDGWALGSYLMIDGSSGWSGSTGGTDATAQEAPRTAPAPAAERWIDVNRSSGAVTLYSGDVAEQTVWGVTGWDQTNEGFYATANGTFYVFAKNEALTWTPWANAYISEWVGFDPDRSNGFHGYTQDANGNVIAGGDGPTGGCVALEPWAASVVYAFADYGMRVEVHW